MTELFWKLRMGLVLCVVLALAGCATPQQLCITKATAELRALNAQIKRAEDTLARGYAIHRQTVPYTHTMLCYDDEKRAYPCQSTRLHRVETPVSVDMDDLRVRLKALKTQKAKAEQKARTGIKACQAHYAE